MNMRGFLLVLAVCFALPGHFQTLAEAPPKRVALVIGNSNYIGATPKLPNPVNDAALMAETLRGLGFDVDVRTDLSRGAMDEAFRAHRDRLSAGGPEAVGLFYYAGHGVQLDDANYLIPVSSTARFRQDVRSEPQLGTAISYMREAGNAVNIVIIDACKDSPYPDRVGLGRTAAGKNGLSTPGRSEGVFIAYAAQPGQTAADGAGANSPFAAALADVMQVPGLDLDDVFQEIASRVVDQSGGEQWPYYSSGLIGRDVCLAGCESVAPQPLLASDESTALAQAITANTLAAFTEFRDRFPASANMAFVETKIAELTPQATDFTKVGRLLARSGVAGGGAERSYEPGSVFRDVLSGGGDGPEMVVVPSGKFIMGSSAEESERDDDEGPQRIVQIAYEFAVGKYEVSWSEWEACIADGGCNGAGPEGSGGDNGWGKGNRPVIEVDWNDAQAYVSWLSRKTGKNYRLLSEAEWEYAARAGANTNYPWGDIASHEYANYGEDKCCEGVAFEQDKWLNTSPVGAFKANGFGLNDMHGNVWEWTQDCWNESYVGAPVNGDAWESGDCSRRMLRGGSWRVPPGWMRSADRSRHVTSNRLFTVGFRVARTL